MCDARMYAAFLLRSLGYSDTAGDFSYSDAAETAAQLGVYDLAAVDTELFNRDDAAAASYTALAVSPKGKREHCSTVSLSRALLTRPLLRRSSACLPITRATAP